MRLTQKTQIALIAIFAATLVSLFALVFLRRQLSSPPPPVTLTATPNKPFVLNIPQKALWRNYVTVSAEAPPGTVCKLFYVPPADKALEMGSIANSQGLCEWTWKIEETQGKGNGRLIFTIEGISETHFIEIRSAF
jgi:hypothetical protein